MARSKDEGTGGKLAGLFDKLNRKLVPYIGPPPLGPYNETPPAVPAPKLCPLCGVPMSEHEIDRSGERTQLYCPRPSPAA